MAFVLEGASFTQAFVRSRRLAQERGASTWDFVIGTSDTTLRAVFFEDAAALVGLVIAGAAIALHQVTGVAAWDAVGSILVGVPLAVVAVVLIGRNLAFIVGTTASPTLRARVGRALLEVPTIERITSLNLEYVGPNRLFIVAEVDLAGDDREHDVARRLRTWSARSRRTRWWRRSCSRYRWTMSPRGSSAPRRRDRVWAQRRSPAMM